MEVLLKLAVPALIGLVAGVIGSLIAPWVTWGIEKRKLKLNARRKFLAIARKTVSEIDDMTKFRENAVYSQLRPFLSERSLKLIESDSISVQLAGRGTGVNNYKPFVYDDIHALEARWGLL